MTDINVNDLTQSFLTSAEFYPGKNSAERQQLAQIEAKNRFRQHQNNEKALAMSLSKSSLTLLNEFLGIKKQTIAGIIPPRPGLQWNPMTHRWIRPGQSKFNLERARNAYEDHAKASRELGQKLQAAKKLYYTGRLKTNEYARLMREYNQAVESRNAAKRELGMVKSRLLMVM